MGKRMYIFSQVQIKQMRGIGSIWKAVGMMAGEGDDEVTLAAPLAVDVRDAHGKGAAVGRLFQHHSNDLSSEYGRIIGCGKVTTLRPLSFVRGNDGFYLGFTYTHVQFSLARFGNA
jgi:hypothetical protein